MTQTRTMHPRQESPAGLLRQISSTSRIIRAKETGHPTFIQLPPLAPGTHLLTVKAQRSTALADVIDTPAHEGFIELRVREPDPWVPGTASHAGLIVTGDPHDASLESFWENEYSLSVMGPVSRSVTPTVILEDGQGEEIFRGTVCSSLDLPVEPEVWRKRFGDFLQREKCRWKYLEASAGSLALDGQDLGTFSLRFENELRPLRWVLSQDQDKLLLRLVDDTGHTEQAPTCLYFPMEEPARVIRLDLERVTSGIDVQPPGGLFLAQNGKQRDAIVASVGLSGAGLGGLGVSPSYANIRATPDHLVKLLQIWRYWRSARVAGFVAGARRQQVLNGLLASFYGAICGQDWATAESDFAECSNLELAIARLKGRVGKSGGFSVVLERDSPALAPEISAVTNWYADVAGRYRVCGDPKLCKFAVMLAFRPHRLPRAVRSDLANLIERLMKWPNLLRGARFVALICANAPDQVRSMYPRW